MRIFLGAELAGGVSGKWSKLQREFSAKLEKIKEVDYGSELAIISIISIIMPDEYFEGDGYKERKYYNKKEKTADIRLRINYKIFTKSTEEKRRDIYINHIMESIQIAGSKAGGLFQTDRLLLDLENLLRNRNKTGDGLREPF